MPTTSSNHPPAERLLWPGNAKTLSSQREPGTGAAVLYHRGDAPQRDVTRSWAEQMNLPIVAVFVERDHAAQAVAERAAFRAMLAAIETDPTVRYVITPTRACVSRRQLEVAITKRTLATMGVTLIFAKEEVGERPMAEVMEAIADIMHGIDGGPVS
ncbi:MAG: recombinase family protein [Thermomicrobiales bacterium]